MNTPIVSVCIPTYNGDKYIKDTVNSVLSQKVKNIEIIISDDCSSDTTESICRNFSDKRIKYFRHSKNIGPKENWNFCLQRATGKYYKLLPHDDLLLEDSLVKQVKALEDDFNKEIALVIGSRMIINSNGDTLMGRVPLGSKSKRFSGTDLVRKCLRNGSNIIGEPGNGLVRTELAKQISSYDDTYPYTIDLDFWFKILNFGDAEYINIPTSAFRIHENSWSSMIGKKQHSDFVGTINKFASMPEYDISVFTAALGKINSKLKMHLRHYIFKRWSDG